MTEEVDDVRAALRKRLGNRGPGKPSRERLPASKDSPISRFSCVSELRVGHLLPRAAAVMARNTAPRSGDLIGPSRSRSAHSITAARPGFRHRRRCADQVERVGEHYGAEPRRREMCARERVAA